MKLNSDMLKIFVDARNVIDVGWCRDDYKKGNRYCSVGSLAKALGAEFKKQREEDVHSPLDKDGEQMDLSFNNGEQARKLREAIALLESHIEKTHRLYSIADWNDDQPSKKPVLAKFDEIIKELQNG